MRTSRRLYRLFLRLYPAEFRERYGVPLERQFADDLSEVEGWGALLHLWLATIRDLATSIPAQLSREIAQDLRHTLRLWRRRPMPVAFAIAILAVAIGANTGMFSVINALLIRALPFEESGRLAALRNFAAPRKTFDAWRRQSHYLADAATYDMTDANVEAASQAVRVPLAETSSNLFALLGTRAAAGRTFVDGEDAPGRNAVAVIGYGLWQRLYAGDSAAIGSSVRVNGVPLTIVGVAPAGFDFPRHAEIWTPTTLDYTRIPKTGSIVIWKTIGRLRPSMTWPQARAAFDAEALARDPDRSLDALNRPALTPLQEELAAQVKPAALVLLAGVGLLLVLACANVANLLLARTVARSNELAIRMALGASRGRLAQQLLTETLLMSAIAAAGGCLIARWSADVLASVQPAALAAQTYTVLDWRVLTFAAALSIVTGLAFGVTPAFFASRVTAATHQRTTTAAARHTRLRNILIAAQVAVTVALLSASVALGRAFITVLRTDLGYDVASIATLSVSLAGTPHDGGAAWTYLGDVFSRVRTVPGVSAVSATETLPLNVTGFMAGSFKVDGQGPTPMTLVFQVAPSFFQTMGTRVLAGREFTSADLSGSTPLAVVNDTLARRFGGPSSVVGRRLTAHDWTPMEIVGVVADQRYVPGAEASMPHVFLVSRAPRDMTIVARVQGSAGDRLAAVRDAVRSVDPKVAVFDEKTMDERFDAAVARPRFYALAVVFFGGVALLLSIIGVYGVVSFAVVQRTREMGVRLALGTTPAHLRAWLLRHMLGVVIAGAVIGVGLSLAFDRSLQSLIVGAAGFRTSGSFAAVALTLAVAAAAIWRATHSVARLEISDVLRAESAD